jgi:hypothetical protein
MSNVSLYNLAAEYRAAADKLADLELDPQTVSDTLEGMAGELEAKGVAVVMAARSMEALAASIKQAEQEMADRRKRLEKRAEWLREYVRGAMEHTGLKRIECPHFVISLRANPEAVDVFDAAQVPAAFMKTPEPPPAAPDKTAIKQALKDGVDVPGARLVRGQRLEVR